MALAAGVAIGMAILCRQSWLLGLVPACVSIGLPAAGAMFPHSWPPPLQRSPQPGFYAPLGRFWEWNVTDSPGFVFAGTSVWSALGSGLASIAGFAHFHPSRSVAVGVALGGREPRQSDAGQLPGDIDLWLWAASGLAAWAAGLRFFGHYWLQVVPAFVLIAVPVVAGGPCHGRALAAIVGVAVPAVAAWVLLFVPGSFHDRPDPDRSGQLRRGHTPTAADRVFVWGSYPEVLVAADRLPAGGLVHTDFVVGRSGGRNDPAKTLSSAVPARARHHAELADRNTRHN